MKKNKKTGRPIIPLPAEKDFSHLKNQTYDSEQLYILQSLAMGFTHQQIGDSLGLSAATSRKYLEYLREKLEARCWGSAYRKALLLGLLPLA